MLKRCNTSDAWQGPLSASIQGAVTDSADAAITDCQVTVTNVGTQAARTMLNDATRAKRHLRGHYEKNF